MSARLAEIARQTVNIARVGGYVNESGARVDINDEVRAAVAGTRLYEPGHLLTPTGRTSVPIIEVTDESTLVAAHRLGPDAATLVFASARNPGGGFLGGAKAQEESVARSSALYTSLISVPDFYAQHRADRDLRYSDRVIYSPRVPVYRDDKGRLLDQAHVTSFLTAAAPNRGAIARSQPERLHTITDTLRRRAARVLTIASAHGHRDLVLGAWGCGVFRNEPEEVGAAFAVALAEVPHFDRITFAILDPLPDAPVRRAFEREVLFKGR